MLDEGGEWQVSRVVVDSKCMFFRNKGGIHRLKRVRWCYRKLFLV
jgi:hypothetical protein